MTLLSGAPEQQGRATVLAKPDQCEILQTPGGKTLRKRW